jgi:hypothetical protein
MLTSLFISVAVIGLVILHVTCLGYWTSRLLGFSTSDAWCRLSVGGGLGLSALAAEIFILGYVGCWTTSAIVISAIVMLVGVLAARRQLNAGAGVILGELGSLAAEDRLLSFASAGLLIAIVLSGLRPPFVGDELQYHWAAPKFWAQNHHWVLSPFKLTNGPVLAELLYVFSAIFSSSTAAHWTHVIFLLILLAGCTALAKKCGGLAIASVAGCLSCPCIATQAPLAMNDLAAAALVVASYTAFFSADSDAVNSNAADKTTARLLVGGMLLAGAISTKPIMVAALPVALIYASFLPGCAQTSEFGRLRIRLARCATVLAPLVVVGLVWVGHTYALTGQFTDPTSRPYIDRDPNKPRWDKNVVLVTEPSDPMWKTGAAAGRIPRLSDILMLPLVPIICPVAGRQEPYGGRTGLIYLFFVPVGLGVLRGQPASQRRNVLWLLAAAITYFWLLGPVFIKTRFHIFAWAVFQCIAALGFTVINKSRKSIVCLAGIYLFYLLAIIGFADVAHDLVKIQ